MAKTQTGYPLSFCFSSNNKFIIPPLFIPSNMAMTLITEEAKVLCMKAMGTVSDQANPNLRHSFVSSTLVYHPPVFQDELEKSYPCEDVQKRIIERLKRSTGNMW
jgi:hypothetical protein